MQRMLDSYFEKATVIGSKTELKKAQTQTRIKDTVQEFHLEKLFASYRQAWSIGKAVSNQQCYHRIA